MDLKINHELNLPEIIDLYESSFPKEERKPVKLILDKYDSGNIDIISFYDKNFIGFAIIALYSDYLLIDYFAISKNFRGQSYGSKALNLIKEKYFGKTIVLEIEIPDENSTNAVERIKRKNFYLKNGFFETNIKVSVYGVDLELLSNVKTIEFEKYKSVYSNSYGKDYVQNNIKIKY